MDHKVQFLQNISAKDFNKAITMMDNKQHAKALRLLKGIHKVAEFKELLCNIGVAYRGMGDLDKSLEYFRKANDPKIPFSDFTYKENWEVTLSNIGLAYFATEQDDIAEAYYRKALDANPLYYDAIFNLSLAVLRQVCSRKSDRIGRGWEYYTYRFNRKGASPLKNDNTNLLMWDFKTKGDSIVVLVEQGYGDNIMFGAYLSELEKYFKKIWIQCTPDLAYIFDKYSTCNATSEAYDATYAVPMCSLGKLLDYIPNAEWLSDKYKPKDKGDKLEIMCIWAGNPDHVNSSNRNIPAGYFDKFHKYGNLHSVVKRKGYTHMPVVDWKTTIEYLEKIDIVVTIDSSMAHLCGALGKPCLVIMPLLDGDFRWGDSSMGYENLWYRSVKVIRNPRSWDVAMKKVEEIISAL